MDTPPASLAERLVLARSKAGLSQDDVAREVGIAQPSYSALERGRAKATTKIGSLAQLYRVDAYWLETGRGEMRPASGIREERKAFYPEPPSIDQARTSEERKLLRLFRALTDAQRRGLLALLGKGGE